VQKPLFGLRLRAAGRTIGDVGILTTQDGSPQSATLGAFRVELAQRRF